MKKIILIKWQKTKIDDSMTKENEDIEFTLMWNHLKAQKITVNTLEKWYKLSIDKKTDNFDNKIDMIKKIKVSYERYFKRDWTKTESAKIVNKKAKALKARKSILSWTSIL